MTESITYTGDPMIESSNGDETYAWAEVTPPFVTSEAQLSQFTGGGVKLSHYSTVANATVLSIIVRPSWIDDTNDTPEKRIAIARASLDALVFELGQIADLHETRWIE